MDFKIIGHICSLGKLKVKVTLEDQTIKWSLASVNIIKCLVHEFLAHLVLMVSYCDRSMSVVCCLSSIICFKSLLLLNPRANVIQTS